MNEFIEKLIGRLEEYRRLCKNTNIPSDMVVESCINIVNELAEEYKSIMNYNTLLNDIKSQLKSFIADSNNIDYNRALVEAIEVIDKKAEEHNGGWIPCENELPKETGYYLVTYKKNGNLLVGYWLFNGIDFNQTEEAEVLYWQPLPEPYKEKE